MRSFSLQLDSKLVLSIICFAVGFMFFLLFPDEIGLFVPTTWLIGWGGGFLTVWMLQGLKKTRQKKADIVEIAVAAGIYIGLTFGLKIVNGAIFKLLVFNITSDPNFIIALVVAIILLGLVVQIGLLLLL